MEADEHTHLESHPSLKLRLVFVSSKDRALGSLRSHISQNHSLNLIREMNIHRVEVRRQGVIPGCGADRPWLGRDRLERHVG